MQDKAAPRGQRWSGRAFLPLEQSLEGNVGDKPDDYGGVPGGGKKYGDPTHRLKGGKGDWGRQPDPVGGKEPHIF